MEIMNCRQRTFASAPHTSRSTVVYRLVREGADRYGVECYIKNHKKTDSCLCRDITRNRQQGERLFRFLIRKGIYPVHLRDILEDLTTY